MPRSPASGTKPDKTMSSRLLTMKFMQRAAASKESPQPGLNNSSTSSPKRQRLSTGGAESPVATPSSDLEQISAALAAEEEKRKQAVARQAAEAGESEWFLDFGVPEQYAQQPLVLADTSLDADNDDIVYGGRQLYGNFKRKNKPRTHQEDEDADSGDVNALIDRAKKQAKEQHRPRVNLSKLTSISGGRQGTVGGDKPQKKRKHK